MSTQELTAKVRELKELKAMAEELRSRDNRHRGRHKGGNDRAEHR